MVLSHPVNQLFYFRYWPEVYILSSDAFVLVTGQSYDSKFLRIYPELPPTPLQLEEDLEKLKVLENGYKMKVSLTYSETFLIISDTTYGETAYLIYCH